MFDTLFQYDLVPFLVTLTVLVFIHELGHYLVARRCGVKVEAFSIGFGPELFSRTDKHGTRWKFCLVPLGGYVKMLGDTNVASAPIAMKDMPEEDKKQAFAFKTLGQRSAIVAAGPAANFLFAILVMLGLFLIKGQPYAPPIATEIVADGAAAKAGLLPGDRIVRIDDLTIASFNDVQRYVRMRGGESLHFEILRNGTPLSLTIIPQAVATTDNFGGSHKMGLIGVRSSAMEIRELSTMQAFTESVKQTWQMTADTFRSLHQIIIGERSVKELGGPIQIFQLSGEVAEIGIASLIMFIAILSVNLGLVNLLPIPALDGGHLLFYAYEAVFGKPMSIRVQEAGAMAGVGLIILLIVVVTWNDIARLI